MKKKIIFMLVLFAIIVGIFIAYKNYYTLEKIKNILSQEELPTNIHILETVYDSNNNKSGYLNIYKKNNLIYTIQSDKNNQNYAESLTDINDYSILISHPTKTIFKVKSEENITFPAEEDFYATLNLNVKYKYYGKEKIDNYNCLKISLSVENVDKIELKYYYIDIYNKHIVKIENYTGDTLNDMSLTSSTTYQYFLDTVTDNDILVFDENNYSDYTYEEQ